MSGADAAAVEEATRKKLKANGSHAEAPDRQMQKVMDAASVPVKDDDDIEENSVESMFKIMMKKMDTVESKVDGMVSKVDGAVQAAKDAKDGVQQVEAKIVTLHTEFEAEKNSRETWQAGMEERFSAFEFKEPAEDVKPADPEVKKKIDDIEKKLAGMSTSDPWARWTSAAASRSAGGATSSYMGKGGCKRRGQVGQAPAFHYIQQLP